VRIEIEIGIIDRQRGCLPEWQRQEKAAGEERAGWQRQEKAAGEERAGWQRQEKDRAGWQRRE